ncbi:hypothetical protein HMPREF1871_01132 [Gemelliphila asaccharolytica]|uniref:Uncharacterized protein n=1 Tax=Gemelliphila asaccharolytica TaxID=502393 RepID=A0ABR5TNY8_9BACL|nr:hypothetical protein HMPREF1871_01132 [Gemella asaccharolytica]
MLQKDYILQKYLKSLKKILNVSFKNVKIKNIKSLNIYLSISKQKY